MSTMNFLIYKLNNCFSYQMAEFSLFNLNVFEKKTILMIQYLNFHLPTGNY